ncbi:4879_t:CDS:2 [Scutellospora calospora]|uniref:4879_t:CDS:1 n=1 Tax=Scutellospora calospora TaxID=85575 RepID=A0ACA9K6I0_9GLOM|nr:4879_t:CDS:2 [Scutellospora calospora]
MKKITEFFEKDSYINKLVFNHSLLSDVIDLDMIDKIMMSIFLPEELTARLSFLSTIFKSEGDQRKVIRFLLHGNKFLDKLLKEHFLYIDKDLITSAKCIS